MKFIVIRKNAFYKFRKDASSKNRGRRNYMGFKSKKAETTGFGL